MREQTTFRRSKLHTTRELRSAATETPLSQTEKGSHKGAQHVSEEVNIISRASPSEATEVRLSQTKKTVEHNCFRLKKTHPTGECLRAATEAGRGENVMALCVTTSVL